MKSKGLKLNNFKPFLASGAIEEYQEPEEPKADGTAARLAELEKANAELTAANKTLTEANQAVVADKAKVDQEVAELKAKVAELEKAKSAAKPKADPKPADDAK